MPNYHATSEGNIPFTAAEETDWAAEQAAAVAAKFPNAKAAFIIQIDAESDALIEKVIGNRGGEYELAEKEAKEYKAAGYPAAPVPGSVSSWATAKGWTATQAADDIITAATGWRTAQANLRANRLAKKEAGRIAVDGPALDTIKSAWASSLAAIKTSLGV